MINKKILLLGLFSITACSNYVHLDDHLDRAPTSFQTCFSNMEKFYSVKRELKQVKKISDAKDLNELEHWYANNSFFEIQKKLSEKEIKENNLHLAKLLNDPLVITNNEKELKTFISQKEAEEIMSDIKNSVSYKKENCYDHSNLGFCFGRATIGHMEALLKGIHPDAILKVWIVGNMGKWGHHVAVMVKAENGWLVIDTNLATPVNIEKWFNFYLSMKTKGAKPIMNFVTRADRFGPYDSSSYTGINLFNTNNDVFNRDLDYYRGYFHDYFEELEKRLTK